MSGSTGKSTPAQTNGATANVDTDEDSPEGTRIDNSFFSPVVSDACKFEGFASTNASYFRAHTKAPRGFETNGAAQSTLPIFGPSAIFSEGGG